MKTDNPLNSLYAFDLDENDCPRFTEKNYQLLSALIRYDSNYGPTDVPEAYETENPENYATILKKGRFPADRETMARVVYSIDAINSTHLSSQGAKGGNAGREIAVGAIMQIANLEDRLAEKDASVVTEIATAVEGRYNISFASKFCAFTSLYALGKDNYCIYDSVIQSILPYYAAQYGSAEEPLMRINRKQQPVSIIADIMKKKQNYAWYRKLIDSILLGIQNQEGIQMSYRQFDQLIWYYFKGRPVLIQRSLNTLMH